MPSCENYDDFSPGCWSCSGLFTDMDCFRSKTEAKKPQAVLSNSTDGLNAKFGKDSIKICQGIYMEYHVSQVKGLSAATEMAWKLGQKIREEIKRGI